MLAEALVLQKDTTIHQLLDSWPQTASFFLQYRMDCIGCSMASFCTLSEAAGYYSLDLQTLIKELSFLIVAPTYKRASTGE